ncbi:unnamed protein product [Adineta ricciae]|uniref:Uncharacterized protein n=1 Tax=Adineta ricciae TaxID=249248 RepID=A0A815M0U7_ADIRI|nr:unnamed protein product [Adineta ricciae]
MNNNRIGIYHSELINQNSTEPRSLCEYFRKRKLAWMIFLIIIIMIASIIIIVIIIQKTKMNQNDNIWTAEVQTTVLITEDLTIGVTTTEGYF